MEIKRIDEATLRISGLDPILCNLLQQIVPSADPTGSEAAQARLFSPPIAEPGEEEFIADWKDYVVPELRQLFQSALEVIQRDVAGCRETIFGKAVLDLPVSHLESWIHGINQARLALAARHAFTEEEMDRIIPLAGDARSFALVQVRFYGILEELFLRELEGE